MKSKKVSYNFFYGDVIRNVSANLGVQLYLADKSQYRLSKNYEKAGISTLTNLTENEHNLGLGGKGYSWIPKTEFEKHPDLDLTSVNNTIPIFQYARSLSNIASGNMASRWGSDSFLISRGSITTPHNMMHDNSGYIMVDALFSITHPIFILYHGFIDYLLELYVRELKREGMEFTALMNLGEFLNETFE